MINVLYEKFPESIVIENTGYPVVTDFRDWIAFFDMINDPGLLPKDVVKASLSWYRDKIPPDIIAAYNGLISFAQADDIHYKHNNKNSSENTCKKQIVSYLYDSPYILGAFRQVYGINLRETEYMHWYEFCALFDALPEDTPIKKRMSYRAVNTAGIKDRAEQKRIRKIQREIAFPCKALSAADIGSMF